MVLGRYIVIMWVLGPLENSVDPESLVTRNVPPHRPESINPNNT